MLYALVYVSTSVDKQSKESLSSLTEQATARNDLLAVTGLLLYSDGCFMQCLEGPKESIDILMKSISSDRRHFGLFVLWQGEIPQREFVGWGMAAHSPDTGLTAMPHAQAVDAWLTASTVEQEGPERLLLEDFWERIYEHH